MNGYLIKINNVDVTSYLKRYNVSRPKLSTDSGRSLTGNLKFTHLGIFPKINLEFRPMDESEVDTVVTILDSPTISVEWWDAVTRGYKTGDFYAGDFDYSMLLKDRGIYDSFKVSLISINKMT